MELQDFEEMPEKQGPKLKREARSIEEKKQILKAYDDLKSRGQSCRHL